MPDGLFLFLLTCVLLLTSQWVEGQTYTIVHERPAVNLNTVTLTCRETGGGAFPSTETAQFWLNDSTTLHYESNRGQPTWMFVVDRNREGEYYCGPNPNQISDKVQVIYRPEYNRTLALLQERVVRVETGETAIIPPYIGPGRWHSRYHIDWFMNHTLVGRVDGRRTPINGLLPERYSVNIGDFSLGIQSVARSDAGRYVGELGVTEVSTPYHYSPRRSTKLLVYEQPMFTEVPENKVIKYQNGTYTTFNCTAKGFPRPEITWTHNSERAIVSKYTQTDTNLSEDTVQSMLTINKVTAQDSGQVRCIATVTPGGAVSPLKKTTEADLSVLKINHAEIKRTYDGGLTIIVLIAKQLPADVHIHLAFKEQHITSPHSFHRGTQLPFFLNKPPFPVNHFTVDVTVMNGHVHSEPFRIVSNVLLNECDQKTVIIVVPVVLGLLIICPCLCVLFCYCLAKCYNYSLFKLAFKFAKTDDDRRAILGCAIKTLQGNLRRSSSSTPAQASLPRESNGAYSILNSELTPVHMTRFTPESGKVETGQTPTEPGMVTEVMTCERLPMEEATFNSTRGQELGIQLEDISTISESSRPRGDRPAEIDSKVKSKGKRRKNSRKDRYSCRSESIAIANDVLNMLEGRYPE